MTCGSALIRHMRALGLVAAACGGVSCLVEGNFQETTPLCPAAPSQEVGRMIDCAAATAAARAAAQTQAAGDAPLASVLAQVGGDYVDELERDAVGIPAPFAAMIHAFMAQQTFPGAFAEEDLRRVHILPASHPGAGRFITEGHVAITLDSLVIFDDALYGAMVTWNATWGHVLAGWLLPAEDAALFTTLHELVHVRQFRELGRERFLAEYLPVAISDGEHEVPFEQEAYAIAPYDGSWSRQVIAAAWQIPQPSDRPQ